MQLLLAFLAKYADAAEDGTINAMGADFDRIVVDSVPANFDVFVVSKFQVKPEHIGEAYRASLELVDPQNNIASLGHREVSSESVPQEQAKAKGYKATMIVKIGLVVKESGIYRVKLSVDGEQLKTWPLEVAIGG